jgi:hypothetical protein
MADVFEPSDQAMRQRVETALAQIQQLQARLDVLRTMTTQRLIALEEWRANGEDLAVDTRAEGLTDVEDTLPMDRAETELADLERRLDQLEQARALEQYQQRDQGMEY